MTRAKVAKHCADFALSFRSVSTDSATPEAVQVVARHGMVRHTGGASTSSSCAEAGNKLVEPLQLLVHPGSSAQVHVHVYPGEGVLRSTGFRPTPKSAVHQLHWLVPFLFGSGCTALGFAAYGTYTSPSNGPPGSSGVMPLSMGGGAGSWLRWPFRSTSTGAAQADGGLLMSSLPASASLDCHGCLPPPLPTPPDALGSSSSSGAFAAAAAAAAAPFPVSGSVGSVSFPGQQLDKWIQAVASLSASAVGAAGGSKEAGLPPPLPAPAAGASPPLTRGSISDAAARAAPAVVHLVVVDDSRRLLDNMTHGSGFIYDAGGYILTNAHVVAGAQLPGNRLVVTLQDGRHFHGHVLCTDKPSDVAVVRIDAGPEPLPCVQCGCSARLRTGEWVVAMGSPLMLRHSVTAGIVSCVERRGCELGLRGSGTSTSFIQTDAALSQGSSGGPLLDLDGQVVGMSCLKAVAHDGVSFAIPVDTIRSVVAHFSAAGRVTRPYVGVTLVEVANSGLALLRTRLAGALPEGLRSAMVVQRVAEGSPAWVAGLQPDDVLLAVAGEQQLSLAQAVSAFGSHIGKPVEVVVLRRSAEGGVEQLHKRITPREAVD